MIGIPIAVNVDMLKKTKGKRFWAGIPPWIFIGAAVVLLPIFVFITIENINRQKENSTRLLLEKGAALIRSFEAGTRTGLMGTQFSGRQLQSLLAETALQRDIVYLLVVNKYGVILAHNDQKKIGTIYGRELDLKKLSHTKDLKWRLREHSDGQRVFEVLRQFSPTGGHMAQTRALKMFQQLSRPHMSNWQSISPSGFVIFIGLDIRSLEDAVEADTKHAVIMASIMLLIGFAGIILLFLTHNYRAAKVSLSRIKAFSDNIVENMPIGLIAIDSNKKIASFNHFAETVFDFLHQRIIGKDAKEILPFELVKLIEVPEIQEGVVEKEVDCSVGQGKTIPLEVSATRLNDEDENFLGYVMLFKDLSEIKALKKIVVRSQRLASVGRLAAGVAHEIRNPLSSIKGFATYFKERYQEVPEDQEIADIMIQEVDRLNRVVGQLLEFARPVALSGKKTDIRALIESSVKLVENKAHEKDIKVKVSLSEHISEVVIDPDKINQVLLNLYLNAIESMKKGGILSVVLLGQNGKKSMEIKISDTGAGIGKKDLPHIFDPYFTTKPSGTGIGLAIVHNIVEAHNGDIKVQSRVGEGTEFTVLIPNLDEGNN